MKQLVLIRHGESAWNLENRFTGWADVNLTAKGAEQALVAGDNLKKAGYEFDIAYTSVLRRAIRTLWHVQDTMDLMWIPVVHSWRLNERHYGALTGLNKAETAAKYGDEQVHIWRRSYDTLPPLLDPNDEFSAQNDPRYAHLPKDVVPCGENLKVTLERVLPFWEDQIAPAIIARKRVLVAAHGNSLRALAKHIEGISDDDIMALEIPTGQPLVYKLDDDLNVIEKFYL